MPFHLRSIGLKASYFAGALRSLVRQLSIDQFENEGRRVTLSNQDLPAKPPRPDRNGMFERSVSDPGVHRVSQRLSCLLHMLAQLGRWHGLQSLCESLS